MYREMLVCGALWTGGYSVLQQLSSLSILAVQVRCCRLCSGSGSNVDVVRCYAARLLYARPAGVYCSSTMASRYSAPLTSHTADARFDRQCKR